MSNCYLCGEILTDSNSSEEHIIPNAIGGKLKAKILCKKCNSSFGNTIDSKLAKSLLPFSNWLDIDRTRGKTPALECKVDNIPVKREASTGEIQGKNIEKINENNMKFSFIGYSEEEVIKQTSEIIKTKAKRLNLSEDKFNKLLSDNENFIKKNMENTTPLINYKLCFGGKNVLLSCLKTAINFYLYKKYNIEYIRNSINILKGNSDKILRISNNYWQEDFFLKDSIYHTIYLKAENNKLFCLISYYNVYQVFILLNDNYQGDDFEETYCYDLLNQKETEFNKHYIKNDNIIKQILNPNESWYKQQREFMQIYMSTFMKQFVMKKEFDEIVVNKFMDIIESPLSKLKTLEEFENILSKTLRDNHIDNYASKKKLNQVIPILYSSYTYYYELNLEVAKYLSYIIAEDCVNKKYENSTTYIDNVIEKLNDFIDKYPKKSDQSISINNYMKNKISNNKTLLQKMINDIIAHSPFSF